MNLMNMVIRGDIKMSNKTSSNSNGIGFTGLLTIVFITLKLTHVIDWSWWWVLSPVWISLSILVIAVLVLVYLDKR